MGSRIYSFVGIILASTVLVGLMDSPMSAAPKDAAKPSSIKFRVSTALSEGCALDPSGMGCPLTVIKVVNLGDPIHVMGVIINRRYKTPECRVKIDRTFDVGDSWSSDRGDVDRHMLWYDFTQYCGKQAVQVDVVTDKGALSYQFGGS
jgi:hypothetical protein